MGQAVANLPLLPDVDAFRAWAEGRPEKWQFIDGALVMMAGASKAHTTIAGNLFAALWGRLRGGRCRPHASDLAVRIDSRFDLYPDVVVDCGPIAGYEASEPVLVAEVLSLSTEKDDRGRKWAAYRRLPSLRHYLLIAQDQLEVELYTRTEAGWLLQVLDDPDAPLGLAALDATIRVGDLYEGVPLDAPEVPPAATVPQ